MSRPAAYVTTETCRTRNAVRPGTWIGAKPVHRHGDYSAWYYAKRETLDLAQNGHTAYTRGSARAVARMMGWPLPDQWTPDADLAVEWHAAENLIGED